MPSLLLLPFRAPVAIALTPPAAWLLFLALRSPVVQAWTTRHRRALRRAALLLAAAAIMLLVGGNFATLGTERPLGHDEVSILSVAIAYAHGQAMYPALDSAAEYGMLYGPAAFLAYLPPVLAGVERFGWYLAWSAALLLAAFALLYCGIRARVSSGIALLAIAYAALTIAVTAWFVWAVRSDVVILLFTAAMVCAAVRGRGVLAEGALAVCGAVLISLKFVLLPFTLVPLLLLWHREQRSRVRRALTIGAKLLLAALPFALPRVSLLHYRQELALAARHGLSHRQLGTNLVVVTLHYLLPLAASLWALAVVDRPALRSYLQRRRPVLLALSLATAALMLSGAKNGAGAWHLMPLSFVYALLCAEVWTAVRPHLHATATDGRSRLALAVAPALWLALALSVRGGLNLAKTVHLRLHDDAALTPLHYADVERDLQHVVQQHPRERMAMGYGGTRSYNVTWMRHILLLHGNPLLLDPNTRNERDASRQPYAPALLTAIARCDVPLWLVPRGDVPFTLRAPYADDPDAPPGFLPQPELFPEPLPSLFAAHYHRVPLQSRYFDLWACSAVNMTNHTTPAAK